MKKSFKMVIAFALAGMMILSSNITALAATNASPVIQESGYIGIVPFNTACPCGRANCRQRVAGGIATVRGDGTNFRQGPGTDWAILGVLHTGARLQLTHVTDCGWYRMQVLSGTGSNGNANRFGWIRRDMIR